MEKIRLNVPLDSERIENLFMFYCSESEKRSVLRSLERLTKEEQGVRLSRLVSRSVLAFGNRENPSKSMMSSSDPP